MIAPHKTCYPVFPVRYGVTQSSCGCIGSAVGGLKITTPGIAPAELGTEQAEPTGAGIVRGAKPKLVKQI